MNEYTSTKTVYESTISRVSELALDIFLSKVPTMDAVESMYWVHQSFNLAKEFVKLEETHDQATDKT